MFYFKKLLVFSIAMFLISCASDDSIPELYFTYKANTDTSESDNWIIIHNENGELLDYNKYEENDFIKFETLNPLLTDKISVTLFSYSQTNSDTFHGIKTTTGVDKGTVWDDKPRLINEGKRNTSIGDFNFTLNNFPSIELLNISNENGEIGGGLSGTGSNGLWTYSASNYTLYEKNDYLFTIAEPILDAKYYFLEDIQDGDDISIDYSEFKLFDSYLNIDIPSNTTYLLVLLGFEDYQDYSISEGYVLNQIFPFDRNDLNQNLLQIGYLDRFTKYRTQFRVNFDNYTYNYLKNGSKPNEIIVPKDPTFNINDNSLQNFKFSTDVNFVKYVGKWSYSTGIRNTDWIVSTWEVESQTNLDHKIGELPKEIIMSYPKLKINSLEYFQTDFTISTEENLIFN